MWRSSAGRRGGERAEQEFFTMSELAEAFDIAGISKSPAIFDIEKLTYFNSQLYPQYGPRGLRQSRRAVHPSECEERSV